MAYIVVREPLSLHPESLIVAATCFATCSDPGVGSL